MGPLQDPQATQKYVLVIRADNVDQVVEESLHVAYLFLIRAVDARRMYGRDAEYEAFAVELLALLQRYRTIYTTSTQGQ